MGADMPTRDHVEILSRETAFQGYFRVDRYRLRHRLHSGGWSRMLTREVFERGHVVAVLPYDPKREEVVLIEQYRIGAQAAGEHAPHHTPWLTEIVAGVIEEGEAPEEVARRETLEETGLAVAALEPVCTYLPSPGGSSESVRLYCARIDAAKAGGIHGHAGEGEDIRVFTMPAEEACARAAVAGFDNAAALIALMWLALNRDRLHRTWQ